MGYKIYAPKPMSDESMEMLRKKGFEIIGEWQDSREDMKKYMAEADVVIARVHFFDDELLALAKNLKLIQVHGVGYQDHVVCEDEEYHWFALAAFLCVLLEVLLRNSVLKKIP